MASLLVAAASALPTTLRTTARRWRRGPAQPSWDWRMEVLVANLRHQFFLNRGRSLPEIRRMFDAVGQLEAPRRRVRWSRSELGGVPVERVRPRVPHGGSIFYLHGGAYVFGSSRSHRLLVADLACGAGAEAWSVDYRLAPEHPCPAAIDDVAAAWRALLDRGVDPASVVWAGDSAGGGLCFTTLLAHPELPRPRAIATISPWMDLTMSGDSHRTHASLDYVTQAGLLPTFAEAYAGGLPLDDPRLSPGLHEVGGLPPVFVHIGGAEVLQDDARMLARRCAAAGVPLELQLVPDMVHVWHAFSILHEDSRTGTRDVGRWIRAQLDRGRL